MDSHDSDTSLASQQPCSLWLERLEHRLPVTQDGWEFLRIDMSSRVQRAELRVVKRLCVTAWICNEHWRVAELELIFAAAYEQYRVLVASAFRS